MTIPLTDPFTSPGGIFAYTYNAGVGGSISASSLVQDIALPYGAAITNAFDGNGRMTVTSLVDSGGTNLDFYSYTYNPGNQRTAVQRAGQNHTNGFTNTAAYSYDAIGQVVGDIATEGSTNRLNEQLSYVFDPAGNLNYRTNNALTQNFQVNSLNELTANTNGGTLTVMGTTTSRATTVTVNTTNVASTYGDATFASSGIALATNYTVLASDNLGRSASNTVTVSIAANRTFQYDSNGNLTNDGQRIFAYDDENQLISVQVPGQYFSQFTYDGKMRRRIRQEYASQGTNWVQTNAVYYVYDGNEVIQERTISNLPTTTYTRGQDLSGSLEGAGGIGGLLARTSQAYAEGPLAGQSFYHSDANGNVTMLINSSNTIVAKYLYDAFGNILSKSGILADANLYRFSSKEAHPNSGLVYYLYRYYDPNLQRWPNRDPLEEFPDSNLYRFVRNRPTQDQDERGLFICSIITEKLAELLQGLGGMGAKAVCSGCGGSCQSCCQAAAAADTLSALVRFAATMGCAGVELGSGEGAGLGIIDILLAHKKFINELKDIQKEREACLQGCGGSGGGNGNASPKH